MGFERNLRFTISALIAFGLCLNGCTRVDPDGNGSSPSPDTPRHLVIIVIDSLRVDHLGCYGYPLNASPTIDRIARNGVVFEKTVATASNTLESVASFFTATTSLKNRVFQGDLPPSYKPLQSVLNEGGVDTYAIVANPWLKRRSFIFKNGFKSFEFITGFNWLRNSTKAVSQAVMRKLGSDVNSEKRNFLYIHFLDPHDAYAPPVEYGFYTGGAPPKAGFNSQGIRRGAGCIEV